MFINRLVSKPAIINICAVAVVALSLGFPMPAVSQSGAAAIQSSVSGSKMSEGKRLWFQCRACHTMNKGGAHKVGPNLFGFYNKRAATRPGFRYSSALKKSGLVWNMSVLDKWIKKPSSVLKRHTMVYAGMADARKRAVLIKYIRANTK